jgi:ferritin-like metal-binding protein YciE
MGSIRTPRDLFLHELGDILDVEQKLTNEVLPKLIGEVEDGEFKHGLEKHLDQTRGHVTNLEQVFDMLGEQPQAEKCVGFEGLKAEHDELMSEVSRDLVEVVDLGAAARTEHYEIAAYDGLIKMARSLGETDVIDLLDENLKQEKEALAEVQKATTRLTKEHATV